MLHQQFLRLFADLTREIIENAKSPVLLHALNNHCADSSSFLAMETRSLNFDRSLLTFYNPNKFRGSYRYLWSVYMNKYTCIYQYVSSRAGGAKGQPLHVCSLTWGGRLHTQRSWTHIYAFINRINVQPHTHIFSMHKTHPSLCAPE